MKSERWEPVIGLELHVQLNTKSKLFSPALNQYTDIPNVHLDTYDLAIPGTLPVLNRIALRKAIEFGLAIEANVSPIVQFDRKSFFYPDLPKGYQICQYHNPLLIDGVIKIPKEESGYTEVDISSAHLEEDAGKSIHGIIDEYTGIDHNRVGTPLLEIVTSPCMNSADTAAECFRQIHQLVVWLGISDGHLHEGSLRCDANISVRKQGQSALGTPVEIKNINSFRFLREALEFEVSRQIELLNSGEQVTRETRTYNSRDKQTRTMRSKEEIPQYRYIPDPDLPPITVSTDEIEKLRNALPELPKPRCDRFVKTYGLTPKFANQLTSNRQLADYFEDIANQFQDFEQVANWILHDLKGLAKKKQIKPEELWIAPPQAAKILGKVQKRQFSRTQALDVINHMFEHKVELDEAERILGINLSSDFEKISDWILQVTESNADVLNNYMNGNHKLLDYLVGQVVKVSRGRADPSLVKDHFYEKYSPKD